MIKQRKIMEQNLYDILVNGLNLNAFYSFIDSKTELNNNMPKLGIVV